MRKLIIFLALLLVSGCGSVISKGALLDVDRHVSVQMVQKNPDQYKGRKVVWGGVIIATNNLPNATRIEVLARTLSYMDRPQVDGTSGGRFFIVSPGYRDTLDFAPEMEIVVAGTVVNVEKNKVGEFDYPYVIIEPIEIKIFDPYSEIDTYDYPNWWDYPPHYRPYYGPVYYGGPHYPGYYPSYIRHKHYR